MYKNIFKYDDMKRSEHMAVRTTVGWYFWTHQLLEVTGPDVVAFLEYMYPNDIASLAVGRNRYTTMLDEQGEIIDDVVIMRKSEDVFWVSTLFATKTDDWWYFHQGDFDVEWSEITDEWQMYAVQGPKAKEMVEGLVKDSIADLKFFAHAENEIDGIPSTGNKWLLKDVLRDEWGWKGMVVTDWNSAGEMIAHGFSRDLKHTAEQAINAGVDMDMMSYGFIQYVEELVKEGKVSEKDIDNAVRNILKLKFELGLFENPYIDETASAKVDYAPEHLEAAKKAAVESAILLQNKGNVLPLDKAKTILVTGPLADAPYEQLGTWAFDGQPEHTVTPLTALRKEYNVIWEPGLKYSRDNDRSSFAKVRAAASRADAAVVFVGEEAILSGEAHSLSNLNLQGAQSELIAEVAKAGKPVVVVVMAGRPLTIERDLANCDAMLYSFHPGTMGGPALADLIKGKAVPSGKTPMTFLRDAGQAPFYYNHNNSGRPCNGTETLLNDIPIAAGQTSLGCTSYYLDSGYGSLFPFGYGLSYSTFEYGNPVLEKAEYGKDDVIKASVELRNTGKYEATEIVQLYVRDLVGSVVRPVKELKGFERVTLAPGDSKIVTFELPVSDLAFWNIDMEYVVEPGDFNLWIAGDSATGESVNFTIR